LRPIIWLIPQYNRKFSYTAAATSTRTRTDAIIKYDTRKGKIIWKQHTGTAFPCWQSDTQQTCHKTYSNGNNDWEEKHILEFTKTGLET
jgi:hypothetical protein